MAVGVLCGVVNVQREHCSLLGGGGVLLWRHDEADEELSHFHKGVGSADRCSSEDKCSSHEQNQGRRLTTEAEQEKEPWLLIPQVSGSMFQPCQEL